MVYVISLCDVMEQTGNVELSLKLLGQMFCDLTWCGLFRWSSHQMIQIERDTRRQNTIVWCVVMIWYDLRQHPYTALKLAFKDYFNRTCLLRLVRIQRLFSWSPWPFDPDCFVPVVSTTQIYVVCGGAAVKSEAVALGVLVVLRLETSHTLTAGF